MTTSTTRRQPARSRLTTALLSTWWGKLSAGVLTAGALAGAITSVSNLVPWGGSDLVNDARITGLSVLRVGIPLGEYEIRSQVVPVAAGAGGRADDLVPVAMTVSAGEVPTDVPTTAPPESSPSPTPTDGLPTPAPSDETSPSPTESGIDGPTTGPLQPDASALREPLVLPDSVRQRAVDEVGPAIEDRVPDVELYLPDGPTDVPTTRLPTLSLVEAASVDDEGNPLPPAEAARRVVEVLGETRTQPLGDKVEPVGTLFSINCELRGLRGSQVLLTWEIYPREGGAPLLDGWLRRTPAYTLQPTTDHDTASVDLWVPLPKEPGTYVVRVALSVEGGGTLHSQVSEPFG